MQKVARALSHTHTPSHDNRPPIRRPPKEATRRGEIRCPLSTDRSPSAGGRLTAQPDWNSVSARRGRTTRLTSLYWMIDFRPGVARFRLMVNIELFYRRQMRAGIDQLTMLPSCRLTDLIERVDQVVHEGVEGSFVECGTWRGGASFLMAKRLAHHGLDRPVWMFDSFEGLPQPSDVDGPQAIAWSRDVTSPTYYDNCRADFDRIKSDALRLGLDHRVRIVKGWFDQTLPASRDEIGKIALLRIDGDWYDSVMTSLETLYDIVSPGGVVIVDDYYDWDGASRAVHDFLSSRNSNARIRTTRGRVPCMYLKLN